MTRPGCLSLLVWGLLALGAAAQQCITSGVEFQNGGSYDIDQGSNDLFSFQSMFQGCPQSSISVVLVSPTEEYISCSSISSVNGSPQKSTCDIAKANMYSGEWTILLSANNFDLEVQRRLKLTVAVPETVIVTVRPTVIVGVTSTLAAPTQYATITDVATVVYPPQTSTVHCEASAVETITSYERPLTVTVTSIHEEVVTVAQTSYYQTTVITSASCHWPTGATGGSGGGDEPWTSSWSWGGGWGGGRGGPGRGGGPGRRAAGAVAAQTSTVTLSPPFTTTIVSYTAASTTSTVVSHITSTKTEYMPAQTVCDRPAARTYTIVIPASRTQTVTEDVAVTRTTGAVEWVGQTQYSTVSDQASATQCWQGGGNYY